MNIALIVPAVITGLALIAHTLVGTQEALSTSPQKVLSTGLTPAVERHWIQNLCAFQMVTVDLLFVTGLLISCLIMQRYPSEQELLFILSAWFGLWGLAWLVQLLALRCRRRHYWQLCQWCLWMNCSICLYSAAQHFNA